MFCWDTSFASDPQLDLFLGLNAIRRRWPSVTIVTTNSNFGGEDGPVTIATELCLLTGSPVAGGGGRVAVRSGK